MAGQAAGPGQRRPRVPRARVRSGTQVQEEEPVDDAWPDCPGDGRAGDVVSALATAACYSRSLAVLHPSGAAAHDERAGLGAHTRRDEGLRSSSNEEQVLTACR